MSRSTSWGIRHRRARRQRQVSLFITVILWYLLFMLFLMYESCLDCEFLFLFFFLDKEEAENVKSAAETEVSFVLKLCLPTTCARLVFTSHICRLFSVSARVQVFTKNIEGQLTPYFSFEMGNGTPCVLKQNEARSTSVLYVCHPEAKHEILSVAEVTTCEYEVVVLTPLLCSHPKYR